MWPTGGKGQEFDRLVIIIAATTPKQSAMSFPVGLQVSRHQLGVIYGKQN